MAEYQADVINEAFIRLPRRSERSDRTKLVDTFVDIGPLFTILSSDDHQIMFGRRGTGKTHALYYLDDYLRSKGDVTVYIDLSHLGSSGGIYSDTDIPLHERATQLLVDALVAIHEVLFEVFVDKAIEYDLSKSGPLLDEFASAITQVKVVGSLEQETTKNISLESKEETKSGITLSPQSIGMSFTDSVGEQIRQDEGKKTKEVGRIRRAVHFGSVHRVLDKMIDLIRPHRIWVLLDEWSSVPIDLQPYLADLFRRSIFSVRNVTVKIAAIEYRSNFQLQGERGDYIGIEVGADAAAGINLDDYMVFDNNEARARAFYKELFFKHVLATDVIQNDSRILSNSDQMISRAFTQANTFDELVRAAEGVPRDAINIVMMAVQSAYPKKVSKNDVRNAARNWYQNDKQAAIRSNERAVDLLHWIIDQVIGQRRARAFLLRSNIRHPIIERLFDSRLLHVLKRNVSSNDEPGIRYDVYKLDYGCYVDLMTTSREPQMLLPTSEDKENIHIVDVPPDDYRSIRRAILDLDTFENQQTSLPFK